MRHRVDASQHQFIGGKGSFFGIARRQLFDEKRVTLGARSLRLEGGTETVLKRLGVVLDLLTQARVFHAVREYAQAQQRRERDLELSAILFLDDLEHVLVGEFFREQFVEVGRRSAVITLFDLKLNRVPVLFWRLRFPLGFTGEALGRVFFRARFVLGRRGGEQRCAQADAEDQTNNDALHRRCLSLCRWRSGRRRLTSVPVPDERDPPSFRDGGSGGALFRQP
jgi:hypothetical protein